MKLTNKAYDVLKFIAQILLPALGTLYFALAKIWGFPFPEKITGTITVICTFLGSVLAISSSQYYKGLGKGIYEDGAEKYDE